MTFLKTKSNAVKIRVLGKPLSLHSDQGYLQPFVTKDTDAHDHRLGHPITYNRFARGDVIGMYSMFRHDTFLLTTD